FRALPTGPNAWGFWLTMICNCVVPQVLWSRRCRRSTVVLFVVSLLVNLGMWCERFTIIVLSLQQDFLPSSWRSYTPTHVDIGISVGRLAFCGFLFLLFLRWVPVIWVIEVKELAHEIATEDPH